MASVTIVGSLSPSGFLARGEQRTVQRTPFIAKLIDGGYVDVVAEAAAEAPMRVVEAEVKAAQDVPALPEQHDGDLTPHTLDSPPPRSASREDWAEFLAAKTSIVTENKTRTELIAEWVNYDPDEA